MSSGNSILSPVNTVPCPDHAACPPTAHSPKPKARPAIVPPLRYIGTFPTGGGRQVRFGDRLRSERERQQYSLDDVAASTKISTRMLRALEEEKFNQLPGGIFNKGFVRAYATFLKMDEEQAIADYLEAAGEAPPP